MRMPLINADIGEWESVAFREHIFPFLGAANIACGGHAGTQQSMNHCLELCQKHQVLPGAHPGLANHDGRGDELPSPNEFSQLLHAQWERFDHSCQLLGIRPHHIKLHGSLYHAVETNSDLASTYLEFCLGLSPAPILFVKASGTFAQLARSADLTVWEEIFADRAYRENGSLVPRTEAGALLAEEEALNQVSQWLETGSIQTPSGLALKFAAQTICLHSDQESSLPLAKALRDYLAS